jgi:DME family drug/metabolite transporter
LSGVGFEETEPAVTDAGGRVPVSILLVVSAAALFGTVGTARELGPEIAAAPLGALRLAVGAAGLVALAALAGHGPRRVARLARNPATWWAAAGMVAFQTTFLAAVPLTGVAIGTLVAIGSAPAFTGILGRRVTAPWLAATAVAVAGLALLVLGDGVSGVSPSGVALALGAGLSYAVYTVAVKAVLDRGEDSTAVAAAAFALAALLLSPAMLRYDMSWAGTPDGLATGLYLALVPTTLAYALFNRGLGGLPARTVTTLGLAEPLVATVLGVAVLGERLPPPALAGGFLVLVGLVMVARTTVRERAGESTV